MKRRYVAFLIGLWAMSCLIGCNPIALPTPIAAAENKPQSTENIESTPTSSQPDLTQTDQLPWLDFSPDGTWIVEGLIALPSQSGEQYYTEMRVKQVAGDVIWTPVATWSNFGLGYTTPRIVHWSADGRYLYFTNAPHPDGCGLFVNASDLQQLDLKVGTVRQILGAGAAGVIDAAPDGTLALQANNELHLLDPATGTDRAIPLDFIEPRVQWGNFVWSPDSQQLAFTVAYDPCIPPTWQQAIYTVNRQGEGLRLVLPPDERRFQIVDWIDETALALVDFEKHPWILDLLTGQIQETSSERP